MWKLTAPHRNWNSLFLSLVCVLLIAFALVGCINVNPPTAQAPVPALLPTPMPSPTTTPVPTAALSPTTLPSPTPTSNEEVPLPRIEAFVADPSYNPGGLRLSGLGDAKVAVDTAWQRLSNQPYYYTVPTLTDRYKPYDTNQLQKVLDELKKTPWLSLYKANYFDCSDMSSLLQRELTIRGFESWIVIGKDPKVPSGHAWVVVFLRSPSIRLVPVEATALLIPQPGSTYYPGGIAQTYEDYTRQGWVLQDIYQAIAWWSKGEFDWWNRTDILQKLGLPTMVSTLTPTPSPTPTPTSVPTPIPTPTPTPTPTLTPAPISQHIETPMQGVPIFSISYMNYTKYLQAGDIIDGVVQLTGPSNAVDNSYQWQFQILGPGGESIKVMTGDFRTTTSMPFHTVASYAGTYRIRVTHQSISTRNLIIDLTPPGWGYANLG